MAKKEPKIGTNIAQYKEAMVQWQQTMTQAQANVAFWEDVQRIANEATAEIEEEQATPTAEIEESSAEEQPTEVEETVPEVEETEEQETTVEEATPTEEIAEGVPTEIAEEVPTEAEAETPQAEVTEETQAEEQPQAEQTEVAEETPTEEQPSAETAEEQPQAEQTEEVTEEYIGQVINSLREVYESLSKEAQKEVTNNLDNFKAEVASRTDEEIATAIADIESTPILGELFERIRNGLLSGEIKRTEQEEQDLINALQRIAQGNVARVYLLPILKEEQRKRAEQQAESKTEPQPKAKAKPKATPKATPKTTAKAKTPKRKKEVNFFKYILPKKERELRPVLAGVFMRDGYRVASDTHILIAERAEYSPALEGRVINEDGIALVDKEGNPIINNLAWQRVIPTPENSSLVLTPIESIMAMLEQAKPLNKIFADDAPYNGNTATEIEIETENGPAFFDSAKLALFMDFVLTIDNPTLAYGNKTRSIWVTSADGSKKAVLMGLDSESDRVEAIRISTRKGIEVGADFSYNNKKTNGLKSELKESEDYIALMKAQPVPPRRELSFHEKKVAQLKALIAIREGKTEFHVGDYVTPNSTQAQQLATKAVMMVLTENRLEPIIATDAMAEAVLGDNVELSVKKKRAPETAYVQEEHHPTVVSSADGAKVLKNLDSAISEYEKKSNQSKTFLGDVAKAIKAEKHGSNSQYATFETVNGKVVTIRLANHNAKVSNFDKNKEPEGISIVVSSEANSGTNNDGKAHVVEFYYNALKLRRSKDKPLVEIIRSIKQALYSGEFKDTTGLAEREEVNGIIEFLRTPQGTIYGWTDGKRIYLTRDGMNPETPVHEYTHLWARAMMQNNAEGWQSIKDLLRDTPMWNEVLNDVNYANIRGNEDAIASEVLSRLSGKNGAQKMTDMAQQLINEGNPQAQTLIGRIRQALQDFWRWVGVNLFDIQNFESIEQVTDRVLWDMVSGTDLGNLSPNQNELMIIGEKGATELDRAEEATHRMDNLNIAREMETAGKDAKVIRMATGWERGADGKWRYEIEDFSIKEEKIDFITNQLDYKNTAAIMLIDLLDDAQGLFAAYPDLRNMRVVIKKDSSVIGQGELQWYDAVYDRQIVLNEAAIISHFAKSALDRYAKADVGIIRIKQGYAPTTKEKFTNEAEKQEALDIYIEMMNEALLDYERFKSRNKDIATRILTHEIQHAIQFIEGFAIGSSPERFADVRGEVLRSINFMTSGDLLNGSAISNSQSLRDALDKKIPYTEISLKEGYADNLQKVARKYGYNNIDALVDDYENMPSAFEQYRRTAGEVESRNVQKRMDMSDEQRRETLLAETEDVAREDQIFIMENSGVSQMAEDEMNDLISQMKANATVVPSVEITEDNWVNKIETPIGEVKMGEHQKTKLFNKGREKQYGMLLETLNNPDIILEEKSKEDPEHERDSVYLFIKTFQKEDGSKYVHFESVTVQQDGLEVSISSHIIRENQLRNKMKSDRLLYKATALDRSANQSAEQPIIGGGLSSTDKVNNTSSPTQENDELFRPEDRNAEWTEGINPELQEKYGKKNRYKMWQGVGQITQDNVASALYVESGIYSNELRKLPKLFATNEGRLVDPQATILGAQQRIEILDEYKAMIVEDMMPNATKPAQEYLQKQVDRINETIDFLNEVIANPEEASHNPKRFTNRFLFRPEEDAADTADTFTSAAEAIAQQLGVEIEIDESMPAKGSYNPRTGRIRINPSRHATAEDVQRTVLHETIGHGGIQAVAGKRFGQVCQQAYDMMTEEPRSLLCQKHQ